MNSSADAIADGEVAGGTLHSIRSGWDRLRGEQAGGTEAEAGGGAERPGGGGGGSGRPGASKSLCISCDSLVQKVLCHLDRSIAKHLEKGLRRTLTDYHEFNLHGGGRGGRKGDSPPHLPAGEGSSRLGGV